MRLILLILNDLLGSCLLREQQVLRAFHPSPGGAGSACNAETVKEFDGNQARDVVLSWTMNRFSLLTIALLVAVLTPVLPVMASDPPEPGGKLAVLWTSGDPEVAHRVALMYTFNAKKQGWFDEVVLILWGPSQRLFVADKDVRAYVKKIQDEGVVVRACVNCAQSYGIVGDLEALGVEVKPMGVPLTEYLKSDEWKTLSF